MVFISDYIYYKYDNNNVINNEIDVILYDIDVINI